MLVRLRQEENAQSPIVVTPSGIVYSVNPDGAKATNMPSTIRHRRSEEAYFPKNEANVLHPPNAVTPIVVILSGIVTLARLTQLTKAHVPIDVTLSGIVMLVRLRQSKNV